MYVSQLIVVELGIDPTFDKQLNDVLGTVKKGGKVFVHQQTHVQIGADVLDADLNLFHTSVGSSVFVN